MQCDPSHFFYYLLMANQQDKGEEVVPPCHLHLTLTRPFFPLVFPSIFFISRSNNQLTRLPESIGYLQQLESLSLQDNRLTCLPDTLGYLVGLVELDASRNQLTRLPSSLGYLDKLQSLHAGHNGIRDLPVQMVSGLRTLVILDVSHNPISVLPAEITQLHFLRRLILDGCPLEAIIHHSTMHPADASSSLTLPLPPMPLSPLVRANSASSLSQNRFITSRALPLLPPSASDANLGDNGDENDMDSDNMDHQHQHNAHAYSLRHNPPSLREQCARQIVRQNLHVDDALPEHLVRYLQTATPCTLCRSPYFDTYVRRGRWIERGNRWIPLEYRLCKAHFSTQQDRLLYLFSQEQLPTLTSPYMQPYRASLPEITRDPPPRPATPNNNAAPPAKFRSHRMKVMNRNQSGFLSLSKLQVAG
ncbi:hypothetical protein BC940DRAFT_304465 [Gongronella butleri]|nr:hypothetical protein BC940DRAFT_304465 [Gongronella butleri]